MFWILKIASEIEERRAERVAGQQLCRLDSGRNVVGIGAFEEAVTERVEDIFIIFKHCQTSVAWNRF